MVVWYVLGREWPWISGSLSEPLFCDFPGIVNEGFTIPRIVNEGFTIPGIML